MHHISWLAEAFDFTAATLCKYAKWQNIKGKRLCFLIWFVCSIYWFVVDIQRGLYAQALFCIPTAAFQIYGYYEWKSKRFGEQPIVNHQTNKEPEKVIATFPLKQTITNYTTN